MSRMEGFDNGVFVPFLECDCQAANTVHFFV